jgi:cbb3-type cytochrome oxidase maturation protein
MNVIYYLIPVAILFVIVGVIAFFWATKTEQFDDLEKQGLSILMDDDELPAKQESKQDNS